MNEELLRHIRSASRDAQWVLKRSLWAGQRYRHEVVVAPRDSTQTVQSNIDIRK